MLHEVEQGKGGPRYGKAAPREEPEQCAGDEGRIQGHMGPVVAVAYRNPCPLTVPLDAITAEKLRRSLEDGHCDISGIAHLVKAILRKSHEAGRASALPDRYP